jgi:Anticodon binding domain of tRNAs
MCRSSSRQTMQVESIDTRLRISTSRKVGRLFNFEGILTPVSANAIVADVRGAVQRADHATVGVDLHPTAWNAITASQTWITNDNAWRALLDETPELQKEVGTQLREHINGKRTAGHKLIFLFSLRDEKLFMYHLT